MGSPKKLPFALNRNGKTNGFPCRHQLLRERQVPCPPMEVSSGTDRRS